MTLFDLRMQLWHTLVVEWYFSANKNIKDDAETPNVYFGPSILLCLEQFGGGKVKTSTERLELVTRGEEIAEAEVDNLNIAGLADEDVFNLQVTMDNAIPVTIVQCTGDLTCEFPRLLLLQASMRDNVVQHLPTIDELEQHIPVIVGANDVFHAADVGVVEQTDDGSFSGGSNFLGMVGSFAVRRTLVLVLGLSGDDLDSNLHVLVGGVGALPSMDTTYLFTSFLVFGQLHFAHASRANCLA